MLNRNSPGGNGLVGIRRSNDNHAGNRSQSHQLLDGLMGRAVLSHGDAVVGENINHRQTVHGRQTHRRTHIVAEDQEGSPKRDQATVQRHAIQDGAHGMLANAKVHVASRPVLRLEVPGPFHVREGAGSKIGRASHHFGQMRVQNGHCLTRCDAGCHWGVRRGECREIGVPTFRKLAVDDPLEFSSQFGILFRERLKT